MTSYKIEETVFLFSHIPSDIATLNELKCSVHKNPPFLLDNDNGGVDYLVLRYKCLLFYQRVLVLTKKGATFNTSKWRGWILLEWNQPWFIVV